MEYLFIVCELAAAFAGFTALIAVLHPDTEAFSAEYELNKLRLRQMLEVNLFTISAGLAPVVILSMGVSEDTAMRWAGAVFAASGSVLMGIQVSRGTSRHFRSLRGYSAAFARFVTALGILAVLAFALAPSGFLEPRGWYFMAVTMTLAVAAIQFLRTATSVLRVQRVSDPGEFADGSTPPVVAGSARGAELDQSLAPASSEPMRNRTT